MGNGEKKNDRFSQGEPEKNNIAVVQILMRVLWRRDVGLSKASCCSGGKQLLFWHFMEAEMWSEQRIHGPQKYGQGLGFSSVSVLWRFGGKQQKCYLGKYAYCRSFFFCPVFCVALYAVTWVTGFQGHGNTIELDNWKGSCECFPQGNLCGMLGCFCYSAMMLLSVVFSRSPHTCTVPISLMEVTSEALSYRISKSRHAFHLQHELKQLCIFVSACS